MSDLLKKGKKRQFVPLSSQDDLTVVEHPNIDPSSNPRIDDHHEPDTDVAPYPKPGRASPDPGPLVEHGRLHRGLSARQVQMIAIGGEQTPSCQSLSERTYFSWIDRNHRNGFIFGYLEIIGPRRTCGHPDRLFYRWLHCICYTSVTRGDGHSIPRRRYA